MKRFVTAAVLMLSTVILGGISPVRAIEPAKLSAKQIKELVTNAKNPADHRKLAAWYTGEAAKLETQANDHESLADIYENHPAVLGSKPNVPISGGAMHCNNLAKSLRDAAREDRELAAEHELMAKGVEK